MANGLMGLDVMRAALEFAEAIRDLGLKGSLRDQLVRASESVVLNIAESDPAEGADRLRGFRIALKEASECKGGLLILNLRKRITPAEYERMWKLNDRICAMVYKLSHPD